MASLHSTVSTMPLLCEALQLQAEFFLDTAESQKDRLLIRGCNQVQARAQIIRLRCDMKSSLRTSWEVQLVNQILNPD